MVRTTVEASTLLGNNYKIIELEASTYTPRIDTAFTLTATCKDVYGDPVEDEPLTLLNNGAEVSTETTDTNGQVVWTIQLTDWDNHRYTVGTADVCLKANGWRRIIEDTNYNLYANEDHVRIDVKQESNSTQGHVYAYDIPEGYAPLYNCAEVSSTVNTSTGLHYATFTVNKATNQWAVILRQSTYDQGGMIVYGQIIYLYK